LKPMLFCAQNANFMNPRGEWVDWQIALAFASFFDYNLPLIFLNQFAAYVPEVQSCFGRQFHQQQIAQIPPPPPAVVVVPGRLFASFSSSIPPLLRHGGSGNEVNKILGL